MGLDAFIPCNCFVVGQTTEPPVPREWIIRDDEGYFCLNPECSEDDSLNDKIYLWSERCCKHSGMHVWQHIGNWSGVRAFQQSLIKIGEAHFPVLTTALPNGNGGSLSIENIRKALAELEQFESLVNTIHSVYLMNNDNQKAIYEYIDAYKGRIIASHQYSLAFNINGLNIFESETGRVLFQAKNVEQNVYLYPQWIYHSLHALNNKISTIKKVRWINVDSGEFFETPWGLSIDGITYPKSFSIVERPVSKEEYKYIIDSLKKLFLLAIEMNNPVFWC